MGARRIGALSNEGRKADVQEQIDAIDWKTGKVREK
jgi:hypothetical protein